MSDAGRVCVELDCVSSVEGEVPGQEADGGGEETGENGVDDDVALYEKLHVGAVLRVGSAAVLAADPTAMPKSMSRRLQTGPPNSSSSDPSRSALVSWRNSAQVA